MKRRQRSAREVDDDRHRLWRAGEIARLCVEAGAPQLVCDYVASAMEPVQVAERLSTYVEIQRLVAIAAKTNLAVDPRLALEYFDRGMTVADAAAALAALPQVPRMQPPPSWAPFDRRRQERPATNDEDDDDE